MLPVIAASARRSWRGRVMRAVPVVVANLIAAAVLVTLLIPGILTARPGAEDIASTARAAERIEALNREIGDLHRQSELAVCAPEQAGNPDVGSEATALPPPPGTLPPIAPRPDVKQTVVEGAGDGEDMQLVELLERSVVMVVARTTGGTNEHSIGTGFMIGSQHAITNQHVVGDQTMVDVTSKRLGRVLTAKVVARTPGAAKKGELDFAILVFAEALPELVALPIADNGRKTQSVLSAGYPGFLLGVDAGFQKLAQGDTSAAPELIVSVGAIRLPAQVGVDVPFILHTADIAQGNSGGPLVDACGQVLGVNTLNLSAGEKNYSVGWAIAGSSLMDFLKESGVAANRATKSCRPQLPSRSADASGGAAAGGPLPLQPLPKAAAEGLP